MQEGVLLRTTERPKRAFGRSLADFSVENKNTPHGLWPAEEKLLESAARGVACDLDAILPAQETEVNRVRGDFIRFLLLGGDDDAPLHEKGVMLNGAVIKGDIDLTSASAAAPLWLSRCRVEGILIGRNALLGRLIIQGSSIKGILCDSARVKGNVFLRYGLVSEGEVRFDSAEIAGCLDCSRSMFKSGLNCFSTQIAGDVFLHHGFAAEGEVRFTGARISGSLDCKGGVFKNPGNIALNCYSTHVAGNVFLHHGFTSEGEVRLTGAMIGGALGCVKGIFKNPGAVAINCPYAKLLGTVSLSNGFASEGEVNFIGAEIGGDFASMGGHFKNLSAATRASDNIPLTAGNALNLTNTKIQGTLWLGPATAPNNQQVAFEGSLDLQGAYASVFVDHIESWPSNNIDTNEHGQLSCAIRLDGLTYGTFAGVAATDAVTRRLWLLRQSYHHLRESFRPQPFEQLSKVLCSMGHEDEARQIAMFKQQLLQPLRVARAMLWRRPFVWLVGKCWGLFAGYGYRPHRLIVTLIMLWLGSAMVYQIAADYGQFVPADAQVWASDIRKDCEPNWTTCDKVAGVIGFNSLVYSADVLVPVIDLRQRSTWAPRPGWVRALTWAENIIGAICVVLLGAILGGLVKRD